MDNKTPLPITGLLYQLYASQDWLAGCYCFIQLAIHDTLICGVNNKKNNRENIMKPASNRPPASSPPATPTSGYSHKPGHTQHATSEPLSSRILGLIKRILMFIPKSIKEYTVRSVSPDNPLMSQRTAQEQKNMISPQLVAAMKKPEEAARLAMQLCKLGVTDVKIFKAACENNKNSSAEKALDTLIKRKDKREISAEFIDIIIREKDQVNAAITAIQLNKMGASDPVVLKDACHPLSLFPVNNSLASDRAAQENMSNPASVYEHDHPDSIARQTPVGSAQRQASMIPPGLADVIDTMDKPEEATGLAMQLHQLGVTNPKILKAACRNNKNSSAKKALEILITGKHTGRIPAEFIHIIVRAKQQTQAAGYALQYHNMGSTDAETLQGICPPLKPEN